MWDEALAAKFLNRVSYFERFLKDSLGVVGRTTDIRIHYAVRPHIQDDGLLARALRYLKHATSTDFFYFLFHSK